MDMDRLGKARHARDLARWFRGQVHEGNAGEHTDLMAATARTRWRRSTASRKASPCCWTNRLTTAEVLRNAPLPSPHQRREHLFHSGARDESPILAKCREGAARRASTLRESGEWRRSCRKKMEEVGHVQWPW